MQLKDRLNGIVKILKESSSILEKNNQVLSTGFIAFNPEELVKAIFLLSEIKPNGVSLDFGCGNGGWALLAAAAGYSSYGIDINPLVIEHAKKNYQKAVLQGLIDPKVICKFSCGDMIPDHHKESYTKYVNEVLENKESMPITSSVKNPYHELEISFNDIDIIYCWAWPTQSRFLYNLLAQEAKKDTIFVLPAYKRYTQGEHMNAALKMSNTLFLKPLAEAQSIFIGKQYEE